MSGVLDTAQGPEMVADRQPCHHSSDGNNGQTHEEQQPCHEGDGVEDRTEGAGNNHGADGLLKIQQVPFGDGKNDDSPLFTRYGSLDCSRGLVECGEKLVRIGWGSVLLEHLRSDAFFTDVRLAGLLLQNGIDVVIRQHDVVIGAIAGAAQVVNNLNRHHAA